MLRSQSHRIVAYQSDSRTNIPQQLGIQFPYRVLHQLKTFPEVGPSAAHSKSLTSITSQWTRQLTTIKMAVLC